MLPFTGYNMSEYFQHWLDMGASLTAGGAKLPAIYCVNWFRKGADGKFVWPGYGELNWNGLNFTAEQFHTVTHIDKAAWQTELGLHEELFQQLAHHLPAELPATKAAIATRLAA